MKRPMLAAAARTAEKVKDAVMADGATRVLLDGHVGTGRSFALGLTQRSLALADRPSILIRPPDRHVDTAAVALLQLAVGLVEAGLLDPAELRWAERAGWMSRLDDVRRWLKEVGEDETVLLVDDLTQWAIPEDVAAAAKVEAVRDVLFDAALPMVLVGSAGPHDATRIEAVTASGDALMADPDDWGVLWSVVERLRQTLRGLSAAPAAEIALVVAAAALSSVEDVRSWWRPSMSAEQVGDVLAEQVAADGSLRRLWNAWVIGSLAREAIPVSWLNDEFGRISSDVERAVLERCLFIEHEGRVEVTREARAAAWRLPEDGFAARSRDRGAARMQAHNVKLLNDALSERSVRSLLLAAEVLYLGARLGDLDNPQVVPVVFADQVAAIGISAQNRLAWNVAVAAFERALEIDPDDAAARHQLAFSLDNDALEPKRVEAEYVRSIDLESGHASWHARLISFLLIRARTGDALDRWSRSCSELSASNGGGPIALYEKLHLPVSAVALRRSELAFGYVVLDDVPAWARDQLIGYRAHRHRLETLEHSQATGSFVPAERSGPEWWRRGPALLSESLHDGTQLQMWMAGGVESASDQRVDLTVALVEGDSTPRTGSISLQMDDLLRLTLDGSRAACVERGDFVEIGYYGVGAEVGGDPIIRVLPRTEWLAGVETSLDPARYLVRAQW